MIVSLSFIKKRDVTLIV